MGFREHADEATDQPVKLEQTIAFGFKRGDPPLLEHPICDLLHGFLEACLAILALEDLDDIFQSASLHDKIEEASAVAVARGSR